MTYTRLQNQFFSLESILADYKENPSLPPSPVSSLSPVIASPQLNPLYYGHVSAFIPLCPSSCRAFSVEVLFVWRHAFVLHSPALPQHRPHLHPPCHTVCFVRHKSRADLWRPPQCGHTHTRKQTTSWYISNLAPCAGTASCWTMVLQAFKKFTFLKECDWAVWKWEIAPTNFPSSSFLGGI